MKKTLLILLTFLILALSAAPIAFAQTDCEAKICKMATENGKVKEAKCVVYQRTAIVAVKTENFTAQSQYKAYVNDLTEKIKSQCEVDHVFVTRNPKIMKQIEELSQTDEKDRDEAIQKLIEELTQFRPIRRIDLPKITIVG